MIIAIATTRKRRKAKKERKQRKKASKESKQRKKAKKEVWTQKLSEIAGAQNKAAAVAKLARKRQCLGPSEARV